MWPRLASETSPPNSGSDAATPTHTPSAANSPATAPAVAAYLFVCLHVMVSAIGITAEPISTPMARYTNPSERPMPSSTAARPPMPIPNATMDMRDTLSSCLPVAFGLLYVRYTSYVISDETAISSADPAAVTAMNSMASTSTAPASPIRTEAAADMVSPSWTSSGVRSTPSATAASPIVLASANGMANQHTPPSRKALTEAVGLEAMALCQYAWSTNTVPKLPTMVITPNIRPPTEAMVRYAPAALPSTGLVRAASTSLSYMPSMPPVMGLAK